MTSAYETNLIQQKLIKEFKENYKNLTGCEPVVYIPIAGEKYITMEDLDKLLTPFLPIVRGKVMPLQSKCRIREIVELRCIFCHIARNMKYSLKAIGTYLGERDHTTVLHSITTFKNLMETNDNFVLKYKNIEEYLKQMTNPENHESQNLDLMQKVQDQPEPIVLS